MDGLCGFDLFYGCVIEMSPKHRTFSIYDPMEYKSMAVAKKLKWQVLSKFYSLNIHELIDIFEG